MGTRLTTLRTTLLCLFVFALWCQGTFGQGATISEPQRIYRIYKNNQLVELIQAKDGSYRGDIICSTYPLHRPAPNDVPLIKINYPIEASAVKTLMKRFSDENIETLPDYSEIKGHSTWSGGMPLTFEVTTDKGVRSYSYVFPEEVLMDIRFKEYKNVRAILNILRSELNPDKVFVNFMKSLPRRTKISDGRSSRYSEPTSGWGLVEEPQFPGGDEALVQFLSKNFKYFDPYFTTRNHTEIFVYFQIEKDGTISDISTSYSTDNFPDFLVPQYEAEILRVFKMTPQWIPGKKDGEIAKVRKTLRVNVEVIPQTPIPPTKEYLSSLEWGPQLRPQGKPGQPETPNTVTDIEGNVYKTAAIGTQVWMLENLKVTHYRNGDPIPNITSDTTWASLNFGAYCNFNNDENYSKTGRLYNWYAVADKRNIAPVGWHVPSEAEWKKLTEFLGGDQVAGSKWTELREKMLIDPLTMFAGYRIREEGAFWYPGREVNWWSSTPQGTLEVYVRMMSNGSKRMSAGSSSSKRNGYSVLCVKD